MEFTKNYFLNFSKALKAIDLNNFNKAVKLIANKKEKLRKIIYIRCWRKCWKFLSCSK